MSRGAASADPGTVSWFQAVKLLKPAVGCQLVADSRVSTAPRMRYKQIAAHSQSVAQLDCKGKEPRPRGREARARTCAVVWQLQLDPFQTTAPERSLLYAVAAFCNHVCPQTGPAKQSDTPPQHSTPTGWFHTHQWSEARNRCSQQLRLCAARAARGWEVVEVGGGGGSESAGLRLVLPVRGHTRASIVHGSKCKAALSWGGSDQKRRGW
jgi:hypothetical protein